MLITEEFGQCGKVLKIQMESAKWHSSFFVYWTFSCVSPLIMAGYLYSHKSLSGAGPMSGISGSSFSLQDANKHEHGSGYSCTHSCVFLPEHLLMKAWLLLYGSAELCYLKIPSLRKLFSYCLSFPSKHMEFGLTNYFMVNKLYYTSWETAGCYYW